MSKKLTPLILILGCIIIAGGMILLSFWSKRIPSNPPGTIGNTAGNLNNGGLFCEQNGMVYFSNPADNGSLYSMTIDEKNPTKIYDGNVCNILCGGDYLYYFMREPRGTSLDKIRVSHSFYRSLLNGDKVTSMSTDVVICGQLVDNSLFLMTTSDNGLSFYRMNTDRSDKTQLTNYMVNPACAKDGFIYYNGTKTNHYLNALNTETDVSTVLWKGNIWYPVLEGNYFYYLDVEKDYRLCRYDYTKNQVEVLTHDRVDCFNLGNGYIYYQCNSQTTPALKRMHLDGSDVTIIAEGNYTAIHMTSQYVYFKSFEDNNLWYHSLIGSDTYSSM